LRKLRLRPLTEAEAYARCHGEREAEVKVVHIEPRRPRYKLRVSGEDLRRSFESKLAAREEAEAEIPDAEDLVGSPAAVDG
jgi:hypothetical protein